MFRSTVVAVVLAGSATVTNAQVIRIPNSTQPFVSLNAWVGMFNTESVRDGITGTRWDFSTALHYRASLDRHVGRGASLGVHAGFSPVSLRYTQDGAEPPASIVCPVRCNATADIWTLGAHFRAGGDTYGLHQILEISAGVSIFDDFREERSNERLEPLAGDTDLVASVGYGLGYSVSDRFAVSVVQELGFALHKRGEPGGSGSALNQQRLLRVGLRLAIGG